MLSLFGFYSGSDPDRHVQHFQGAAHVPGKERVDLSEIITYMYLMALGNPYSFSKPCCFLFSVVPAQQP